MSPLVLGLLLLNAVPQEDLDTELERLAPKIAAEGAGAGMAELLRTDAGRLIIREKVADLVARSIERVDRDPQSHFERVLFIEDPDGSLRVRPERKREVEALAREIERRAGAWKAFDKAGAEVAAKIPDAEEIGRKLKEYWANPEFRLALYQRLGKDSREPDGEELWNRLIGRSLFRGTDDKLRLRGNYRDESVAAIAEVLGEAQGLAGVEEQVKKVLEKLTGDERKRCATPEGGVVLGRRLVQLAGEGAEDPAARMVETDLQDDGARRATLDEIAELAEILKEVKPIMDAVAKDLAAETENDRNLEKALKDARAPVLLAAKMRADLNRRRANGDAAIAPFRDDHFDSAENGTISLKKGRFVDDKGQDSVAAVTAECDGILNEFAATRAALEKIAERTLDPSAEALFRTREGASAVTEFQNRVLEDLKQAERDGGVRKFLQAHLEKSGDRHVVRPERAARVEEMARRAKEIQQALDLAVREEPRK